MHLYHEFRKVGEDLSRGGLVDSHSGNLSVRLGQKLVVTRSGSMLGRLTFSDLVEVLLNNETLNGASIETVVHRAIYRGTGAKAIVHAHPPFVVCLSSKTENLMPIDGEGQYYFPDGIPVAAVAETIGSREVASVVPPLFSSSMVVAVPGHGTFAIGKDLDEALKYTTAAEHAVRNIYLTTIYEKFYVLP
ncbi:MAG: class II aldolase/adducin family protein [bacterium]|jgi:L-fuculose-phosphate aldolase|nr:class II aldolase/adducin family protein [bacterium]